MKNIYNILSKKPAILNLQLSLILSIMTIWKYVLDSKNKFNNSINLVNLYSFIFFILYVAIIFYSIYNIKLKDKIYNSYSNIWFAGFKLIVNVVLIQVLISFIMELIFPVIKTEFIALEIEKMKKIIFNKEVFEQSKIQIDKYYYYLKISILMFVLFVLGILLNTIICISIHLYFKKKSN